jgi:hypothetical protein
MNSPDHSTSSSLTRRSMISAGLAATGGVLVGSMDAHGLDLGNADSTPKANLGLTVAETFDPDNPLVTIDFSGLTASLSEGIKWVVEGVPKLRIPLLDIDGSKHILTFVRPVDLASDANTPAEKYSIQLEFDNCASGVEVASKSSKMLARTDFVTVGLAVYKIGKAFDVWRVENGRFNRTEEKLVVQGGISFSFVTADVSNPDLLRETDDVLHLNVSNLLAAPQAAVVADAYEKSQVTEYAIPKVLYEALPIWNCIAVTDNGHEVYTTAIDVKKLLGAVSSRNDLISAGRRQFGRGLTGTDIASILTVAEWILFSDHEGEGEYSAEPNALSGTIGVAISIGF